MKKILLGVMLISVVSLSNALGDTRHNGYNQYYHGNNAEYNEYRTDKRYREKKHRQEYYDKQFFDSRNNQRYIIQKRPRPYNYHHHHHRRGNGYGYGYGSGGYYNNNGFSIQWGR